MAMNIQRALKLAREVVEADDVASLCMDDEADRRNMIESIVGALEKAYEDGYSQGFDKGYVDGEGVGYDEGYDSGLESIQDPY